MKEKRTTAALAGVKWWQTYIVIHHFYPLSSKSTTAHSGGRYRTLLASPSRSSFSDAEACLVSPSIPLP